MQQASGVLPILWGAEQLQGSRGGVRIRSKSVETLAQPT